MSSDPSEAGTGTERLRHCEEHEIPCERCPNCKTLSHCPKCGKCYEPKCAGG